MLKETTCGISVKKGCDVYINVIDIKTSEIVARIHPYRFTCSEMGGMKACDLDGSIRKINQIVRKQVQLM